MFYIRVDNKPRTYSSINIAIILHGRMTRVRANIVACRFVMYGMYWISIFIGKRERLKWSMASNENDKNHGSRLKFRTSIYTISMVRPYVRVNVIRLQRLL